MSMTFSTKVFNAERNETLFTVGNGNIGLRGDTEEKALSSHKGTYINGFYDTEPIQYGEVAFGYAKNHETILNLPDVKRIELCVDGERFGCDGKISDFSLTLDMEKGVLSRNTSWTGKNGSSVRLVSERLASFVNPSCVALRYTVENTSSKAVKIALSSAIDTKASNILAEDDPRVGAKFKHVPLVVDDVFIDDTNEDATGVLAFNAHTENSHLLLSGYAINTLCVDGQKTAFGGESSHFSDTEEIPAVYQDFTLEAGKKFTLTKYVSLLHCKSIEIGSDCAKKALSERAKGECEAFAKAGFEEALSAQKKYLDEFWSVSNIHIDEERANETQSTVEEALRFNLFHLLQSAGRNGATSIAAKGLTSEGYEGHYFWDTESYVCPVFTYTAPKIAKKLLEYRASILDKAKERAKVMALKGALYPWRTISGEETSAYFPAGTAQYHINADIIFALNRYLNTAEGCFSKGDEAFDTKAVQEMCAESARMYASLGHFNERTGKFCIDDVTGPDEYTAIVNNNTFTNLMVRETLEIAAKRSGTSATDAEKAEWKHIAENMYIPFDKDAGVYPQDDSFMNKAEWDFEHTPRENYPLLLHYHPLVIYRHRVLKQPDLVLAQFLLSRRFTLAEKIRNYAFYEKYTTGDSSLSHCIMSIMAARTGDDAKALDYFNKTVRMDIDDVNGNSRDGIHTACMAGSWMSVVYGFAGFEDYGGEYSFDPKLPKGWRSLEFALLLKGCVLGVKITADSVTYSLKSGEKLEFLHRNERVVLASGEEKAFSLKKKLRAVLFDLDGVLTNTAPLHFRAWGEMASREGLKFDAEMNKKLLGISREESLAVILRENGVEWSDEKKKATCTEKNERYKELLETLTEKDILGGIKEFIADLKAHGVKIALASSSKNAPAILERLGLSECFDAMADASSIQKAKPEPDLFLQAAEKTGVWYTDCVGIEDAQSGIDAIKKGGITAVGIGKADELKGADLVLGSTAELNYEKIKTLLEA